MKIFQLMLVMTLGLAVLGDTPEDQEETLSKPVLKLQGCSVHGFDDWFVVGPYCAKHFLHRKLSFPEAERTCMEQHHHGHLISVHDSKMKNQVKALTGYGNIQTWIGAYQLDCTHRWFWTDGTKWGYQNWVPGEPNNTGRCAQINWHTPGMYDDTNCCDRLAFVCAFPIE